MSITTPVVIQHVLNAYATMCEYRPEAEDDLRFYFRLLGLRPKRMIFCPTWEEAFEQSFERPYDYEWYERQQGRRIRVRHTSRIYDISMAHAWERRAWRVYDETPNASATARLPCEHTLLRAWDAVTHVYNGVDKDGTLVAQMDMAMLQCLQHGLGLFFPTTEGVILAPVPAEFRSIESRIMFHDFGEDSDKNDLRELPAHLMPNAPC